MKPNLVCIRKYNDQEMLYSFYRGKLLVARVSSPDMDKEYLEELRKNPVKLLMLDVTPKDYA